MDAAPGLLLRALRSLVLNWEALAEKALRPIRLRLRLSFSLGFGVMLRLCILSLRLGMFIRQPPNGPMQIKPDLSVAMIISLTATVTLILIQP